MTTLAEEPYVGHDGGASVSDEEPAAVQPALAVPKPGSNIVLSTIDRRASSVKEVDDGSLTVTFHSGEVVTCVGEYDLEVTQGVATIYGAVLYPNSGTRRVYAPSTHALPQTMARRDNTIIRLSEAPSSLRKLERLSPLFRNIWTKGGEETRTFALLRNTTDDELQRTLNPLELDKAGQAVLLRLAVEAETSSLRVVAIGPKSSGKSTFNRLLCNTLLSKPSVKKLLYLDLDPGQPEFGPPGQLSLVEVTASILGPSFTHLARAQATRSRLIRSHTIAATSLKDDPDHYLACARDLAQHAKNQYPLVVNSCGWVTGLGANVLEDLISLAGITDVVVLDLVEEPFVDWLRAQSLTLHRLPRQPSRPSQRTPAELRAMQTMGYLHHKLKESTRDLRWSAKPLSKLRPWIVGYDASGAGIHAVVSYGQPPNSEFLAEVLDGSLVAMVTIDERHEDEALGVQKYAHGNTSSTQPSEPTAASTSSSEEDRISRTAEGLPYIQPDAQGVNHPLDPKYSECIGLALVRAIDVQSKQLHLVTPLSEGEIAALTEKKVVLVRGGFDATEWAYLEDLHTSSGEDRLALGESRPWVSKREPVGIEGAVWRLRHPPMAAAVTAGRAA